MRVLMTADTVGGVWTYSVQLARALEHHGVEVYIATMAAPLSHHQRHEARAIHTLHLIESVYKVEWMHEPWGDVARSGEWLLDLEIQVKPDVVHLNGFVHGALPFRSPKLVVGHSCVPSWWQAAKGEAAPAEWDHYRRAVRRGIQSADMVVAPTHTMLDTLQEHYGAFRNGEVIYNGRSTEDFAPGTKEERILAVGRLWDEGKNITALARVAGSLAWPVFVAGQDKEPAHNQSTRDLAGLKPLGVLSSSQIAQEMASASIYALPARYEPFGLSALEAGLSGCALVLGDIPTLREVWGDAAIFVPPSDTERLADVLQMLIDDKDYREHMARKARERALRYTPDRMAQGYKAAYMRLTGAYNKATAGTAVQTL